MACSKSFQRSEDIFSNVLDIVCDKILEHLPISIAAQTSVLSKRCRSAWLSLKKLNFDADFWDTEIRCSDWRKCICIISSVLFYHNGPIHDFHLYIPDDPDWEETNLSQWMSFLSKTGVRKIVISNGYAITDDVNISSYIFWCNDLVHLEFNGRILNPPPTDFNGFPNLKHLELVDFYFTDQNNFSTLIGSSRMLVTLKLVVWTGMYHIVIDAPNLQTLILQGEFESRTFRNVRSLESISIDGMPKKLVTFETVDAVNLLASSCQLQPLQFNGCLCKFLATDGNMRSTSVTFNHLDELCLSYLNLNDVAVFHYVLSMIECCPDIKTFDISSSQDQINPSEIVGQHVFDFNYNYKLDHLREVNFEGITGSTAELKLVEYLLVISPVLGNLFFKSVKCDAELQLKMLKTLNGFPRASPKTRLLFLEK